MTREYVDPWNRTDLAPRQPSECIDCGETLPRSTWTRCWPCYTVQKAEQARRRPLPSPEPFPSPWRHCHCGAVARPGYTPPDWQPTVDGWTCGTHSIRGSRPSTTPKET